jgi:hypothetical protein
MFFLPQCPQVKLKKWSSALFFAFAKECLTKMIAAKNTAPPVAAKARSRVTKPKMADLKDCYHWRSVSGGFK